MEVVCWVVVQRENVRGRLELRDGHEAHGGFFCGGEFSGGCLDARCYGSKV